MTAPANTVTRAQYLRLEAEAMSERTLQEKVIAEAKRTGWRVAHFRPARTEKSWRTPVEGDAGFCDLVLARGGRVLMAELKRESVNQLKGEQFAWSQAIGFAMFRFWKPSDWVSGRIQEELA